MSERTPKSDMRAANRMLGKAMDTIDAARSLVKGHVPNFPTGEICAIISLLDKVRSDIDSEIDLLKHKDNLR